MDALRQLLHDCAVRQHNPTTTVAPRRRKTAPAMVGAGGIGGAQTQRVKSTSADLDSGVMGGKRATLPIGAGGATKAKSDTFGSSKRFERSMEGSGVNGNSNSTSTSTSTNTGNRNNSSNNGASGGATRNPSVDVVRGPDGTDSPVDVGMDLRQKKALATYKPECDLIARLVS